MTMKYYVSPLNAKTVADDICVDNELEVLLREHNFIDFNSDSF